MSRYSTLDCSDYSDKKNSVAAEKARTIDVRSEFCDGSRSHKSLLLRHQYIRGAGEAPGFCVNHFIEVELIYIKIKIYDPLNKRSQFASSFQRVEKSIIFLILENNNSNYNLLSAKIKKPAFL